MLRGKLTSEVLKLCVILVLFAEDAGCKSDPALTGSNGANPRLAANRGMFGFHLGPKSCNFVFLHFILSGNVIYISIVGELLGVRPSFGYKYILYSRYSANQFPASSGERCC